MEGYHIYTKPDCPWCDKAKALLTEHNIHFFTIVCETDEARAKLLSKLGGWQTFPVIFEIDQHHKPMRFVGGYEALSLEVDAQGPDSGHGQA